MTVRVFIQNEAGSDQKNYHDEKRLVWQGATTVSRPYPFPYGFIINTSADDGCNVDCFVLTDAPLRTGQVVECEVLGLMEQFEDGHVDHNVLARLPNSESTVDDVVRGRLEEFVTTVFSHIPGKRVVVGRFLELSAARTHLIERIDR
jgi:inorganic pyrophosphatase